MRYFVLIVICSIGSCDMPTKKNVQIEFIENNFVNLKGHEWLETKYLITNSTQNNLYIPIDNLGYVEYGTTELEFCDNPDGQISYRDFLSLKHKKITAGQRDSITLLRKGPLKYGEYTVTDSLGFKLVLKVEDTCSN